MIEKSSPEKSKADRALNLTVAIISGILVLVEIVLLIVFFSEKALLGSDWTNVGMVMISVFLAVPLVSAMPVWLIVSVRKSRSFVSIILYILALILFVICLICGWFCN
jgi:uncharacterized membrane protein (UPF0182 family)